jgi:hypothetical protein
MVNVYKRNRTDEPDLYRQRPTLGLIFTNMKLFNYFVWCQAIYIFVMAIWPIIHIESFMEVTGPKTDIWLVKTVGALLIPISITMITHLVIHSETKPLTMLGGSTALAFICIDLYYSLNDTISNIYLADAAIEFFFLIGWIFFAIKLHKNKTHST